MAKRLIKILIISFIAYMAIFRLEIMTGECLNEQGDGKLNNGEPYYNYINYSRTNAQPGDTVLTIDLLNPFNTYCDDIVYRADFIL